MSESSDPRADYRTDVPYVRHYCGDLNPSILRFVAALNGFESPGLDSFDYCELGCGNGDTLAALAAAYPESRFVGVDFHPDHVRAARDLVKRGELANVRIVEREIEGLDDENLPAFDFVCAHGVMSWVGPSTRDALVEFAARHLRPGGLLHVSYNALPGWAAMEPLRRLLVDLTRTVEGGSLERAKRGIELARLLAEGGAAYFTSNPAAAKALEAMTSRSLRYVVHEYFNEHWHSMYFAEIASRMARSDLYFVGQMPLHLNYRDLTIPRGLLPAFQGIEDRVLFESLKDFAVNESFRRDVYVKSMVGRSGATTNHYLDATPFGTVVPEKRVMRSVSLGHYELKLDGPLYDQLIPRVAAGASTALELSRAPELAAFGADRIRDSLRNLAVAGQAMPMRRDTAAASNVSPDRRYRIPLAFNRAILAQPLSAENSFAVASTAAGAGIALSLLEVVSIRLLTEVEPTERSAWLRSLLARSPLSIRVEGRPVIDVELQIGAIERELEGFVRGRLPKLLELGVLENA